MKIWQGCLLAFALFVLAIGAFVGVVFYATSGITDTADEFFAAVGEGDYEAAHALTSQRLQQLESPQGLEVFVNNSGLTDVVETSWNNRSINNDTGELTGSVTTSTGGTIPMTILFVHENDEWRIDGFDLQAGGLATSGAGAAGGGSSAAPTPQTAPEPMVVPSKSDQEDLLFFTTAAFVNSLGDEDFSDWQAKFVDGVTLEELEAKFARFRPQESAIRRAIVAGPRWNEPTELKEDGQLVLTGTYGSRLRFTYVFEGEGDSQPRLRSADIDF